MNTPWDLAFLAATANGLQPAFDHGLELGRSLGLQATHCWLVLAVQMEDHSWQPGGMSCVFGQSIHGAPIGGSAPPNSLHCRFAPTCVIEYPSLSEVWAGSQKLCCSQEVHLCHGFSCHQFGP